MNHPKLLRWLATPLGVMSLVGIIVFLIECGIVMVLSGVFAPLPGLNLSAWVWGIVGTTILTFAVAPALYFLVFRRLQASEERFRLASTVMLHAMVITDVKSRIIEWNPAAERMFQYHRDEALGKPLHQLIAPARVHGAVEQGVAHFHRTQTGPLLGHATKMVARRKDGSEFPVELSLATDGNRPPRHIYGVVNDITDYERIQNQLKHQVMHDLLTGLPNRGYLCERLDRVLGSLKRKPDRLCALLYLDIDHFKMINDSFGHLAGDAFLKIISARLVSCVRDPDMAARLSGDEFAILLEDIDTSQDVVQVAQRVLRALHEPVQVDGRMLTPSVSIGIAIGDHRYGNSDELLHAADTALYRAKEGGRDRFEIFEQPDALDVEGGRTPQTVPVPSCPQPSGD